MNIAKIIFGIIILMVVGAIPLFWAMVIGGAVFGAPFIPLIIILLLAIAGISLVVSGMRDL